MNYNYGTGSNRVNTQPFREMFQNMNVMQADAFDRLNTPDLAWEQYLRSMMPSLSNTQERTLRSAFSSIFDDFLGKRQMNSMLGSGEQSERATPMSWVEYLSKFDINKELARLDPAARYENQSRFTAPARWVAF